MSNQALQQKRCRVKAPGEAETLSGEAEACQAKVSKQWGRNVSKQAVGQKRVKPDGEAERCQARR